MATTTNYGWTTPDDTGLVKDGASAIRTLGSSIDTTTKALNPSTTLGDIEYRSSTANTNTRLAIGTTGQVLTVAGGVPSWATPASGSSFAGVSLWKSANQSYSSGAGVNATFDSELFDTHGYHSTSTNTDRITIPSGKAGYYLIIGRAIWDYKNTGQRIGYIRKNAGADILSQAHIFNQGSTCYTYYTCEIVANLAEGDYVVFENYQDGTGSLDLLGQVQSSTTFTAIFLGA